MPVHSIFSPLAKQVIKFPVAQRRFVAQTADPDFDFKNELSKLCTEFANIAGLPKQAPLSNIALCSVQHLLGTTGDMFEVMKTHGLGAKEGMPLVLAGKIYSTHEGTVERLRQLGFTLFPPINDQLGLGNYDRVNHRVLSEAMSEFDRQLTAFFLAQARQNLSTLLNGAVSQEYILSLSDPGLLSYYKNSVDEITKQKFREICMPIVFPLDDGFKFAPDVHPGYHNGIPQRPYRVVAAEQTMAGTLDDFFKIFPFPIVDVARSFMKAWEFPGVAEEVATQVVHPTQSLLTALQARGINKPTIGVIGFGSIGKEITKFYERQGHAVQVYDIAPEKKKELKDRNIYASSIYQLVRQSNIIISCTPTDITADPTMRDYILSQPGIRIYCSASSGIESYRELLWALQSLMKENTLKQLDEVNYVDGDTTIIIPRGGTPINFSNQEHSVKPSVIFATRALLTASMFMAASMRVPAVENKIYRVCPLMQYAILSAASRIDPENPLLKTISADVPNWDTAKGKMDAVKYIEKHSKGERYTYSKVKTEEKKELRTNAVSFFGKPHTSMTDSTFVDYPHEAMYAAPISF